MTFLAFQALWVGLCGLGSVPTLENLAVFLSLSFPNPYQRRKTLRFSSSGHLLSLLNTGLFLGEPMRKVLI